jgi:P-type Mg2+ transporter
MPFDPANRFWTEPAADLMRRLGSSPAGMSSREAAERLRRGGPNTVAEAPSLHLLAKVARRLMEPLVAILLVAALVSGLTGDLAGFFIILAIVSVSVAMDVVQERHAELAAARLRDSVAVQARILRDGFVTQLPVEQIVPGDIVELTAGSLVPADGLVLAAEGAQANEALLTGEPYPADKRPGQANGTTPADAFNALFAGTALVGGSATMLVVATGRATRLGGVATALTGLRPPTAFEKGLRSLGLLILRLTAFLMLFVLLANLAFHRPVLESFLFAVALAVGLTPELLPMVTTVTLSRGALRMARKKVVVKRLAAIHDLGAMDVLCTDKTGTLTEARITLADSTDDRALELAAVNALLASGRPTPLDEAIIAAAGKAGAKGWRKLAECPFGFERRRSSVLAEHAGKRLLVVKGAPEAVLAACINVPAEAYTEAERRGAEGLRLLGIAWRELTAEEDCTTPACERGLTFVGFCAFLDPPKQSAGLAAQRLVALGVRVKVISGDAAPVVRHLVQALNLPCSPAAAC